MAAVQTAEGWGFVDLEGTLRIKPEFGAVGAFSSRLAPVRVGRRWGFIDSSGNWIVEPKYQSASDFHEGRARIEFWDRVCDFNNEDAPEHFFQRQYAERNNIPSGQCGAENSRVGYIDTNGAEVISPQYLEGFDFSEGRAHVVSRNSGGFGYIDTTGQAVLPFQYSDAGPFSEGVASVVFIEDSAKQGIATVIDRQGQKMFPPRFFSITTHFQTDWLPRVTVRFTSGSILGPDGVTKIPMQFTEAMPFSEGLAVVAMENPGDQAYIKHGGEYCVSRSARWSWSANEAWHRRCQIPL